MVGNVRLFLTAKLKEAVILIMRMLSLLKMMTNMSIFDKKIVLGINLKKKIDLVVLIIFIQILTLGNEVSNDDDL